MRSASSSPETMARSSGVQSTPRSTKAAPPGGQAPRHQRRRLRGRHAQLRVGRWMRGVSERVEQDARGEVLVRGLPGVVAHPRRQPQRRARGAMAPTRGDSGMWPRSWHSTARRTAARKRSRASADSVGPRGDGVEERGRRRASRPASARAACASRRGRRGRRSPAAARAAAAGRSGCRRPASLRR